jgi:uncharacterized protein YndB with AHSA1/START domain
METTPLIVERTIEASPEKIWSAFTDIRQIRQWYFPLPDFKAEPGFTFEFMGGTEEKQYKHLCRVTRAEPYRLLAYSWKYEGIPGDSEVCVELIPAGESTIVRVTHTGIESFPGQEDPNFSVGSFTEGWTMIIGTLLKEFVAPK